MRAWRNGRPSQHNLDYKVVDNVNITIGHVVSAAFPAKGAPVLPQLGVDFVMWAPVWCHGLTQLPDNAEKFAAQLGLIAICSKQFNFIMQVNIDGKCGVTVYVCCNVLWFSHACLYTDDFYMPKPHLVLRCCVFFVVCFLNLRVCGPHHRVQGMLQSKEFFGKPTMAQEPLLMHVRAYKRAWTC